MRITRAAMALLGTITFFVAVYWTFTQPMNPDEMEHLHSTYLIMQGRIPYVDFWQNHAPILWLLLAPLMTIWPEQASICYVARVLGLVQTILVFAAATRIALLLSRRPEGAEAGAGDGAGTDGAATDGVVEESDPAPAPAPVVTPVFLVSMVAVAYWGVAVAAELPIFRTDGLMILCILLAALASLRAERGEGVWPAAAAGFWVGLGLSFSIKLLPLAVAFPVATFTRWGLTGRSWRSSLAYAAGGVLGVVPLVAYLLTTGSVREFYRWVIEFNQARFGSQGPSSGAGLNLPLGGGVAGYDTVWIPVLLGLFALVGILAVGPPRRWARASGGTVRIMLVLTLFSSVVLFPLKAQVFEYYLAPLVALGAIFVAPTTWNIGSPGRRGFVISGLLGLAILVTALIPTVPLLWNSRGSEKQLAKNLEFIQWMIDVSRGRTVQCDVADHPIYAYDLTPFYIPWQVHYTLQEGTKRSQMLQDLLREAGPYQGALAREKPVLLDTHTFRVHIDLLQRFGLIDEPGLEQVRSTIQRDYRKFNEVFYVSRVKPED